jgi:asparagine synthase (glutamine-hydrolysing)
MCGIWSLVNLCKKNLDVVNLFGDFMNLKHRGPDNSYFETYNNVMVGFHRLAIMDDTFSSNQPFILEDENRTVVFISNGEYYNYKEIIEEFDLSSEIKNDCQVVAEVYWDMLKHGTEAAFPKFIEDSVKGEFAFCLFEFDKLKNLRKVIVGRDHIGIRPLYYIPRKSFGDYGNVLFFASEIKGGLSLDEPLVEFPPGHVFTYTMDELGNITHHPYNYSSVYDTRPGSNNVELALESVQTAVVNSVRRRLCADKPLAFLLSGGVDSSLVAGISAKILGKPIRTFCCSIGEGGVAQGTDAKYARMVADHIGSTHTEVVFTFEDALEAIPDVIRTIESWDTTTIRASVGQYMISKWIGEKTDCRVIMVGEGPDEVCSSYLFNWYAPDGKALHNSALDYVRNIHYYDVKRADRCISRWGLEGRVPLLDPEFIKTYWSISGEHRMPTYKRMEKWWLREAFNGTNLIPDEVLFRRKEAFSDGISTKEKSWFQIIQEWVEDKVTDEELANAPQKYPYCTPVTKEAYYYRRTFCDIFGEKQQKIIPGYWMPKWSSDGKEVKEYVDPSARVLSIYSSNP